MGTSDTFLLDSVRISYADRAGHYIVVENTGSTSRDISGWSLTQMVGGVKNAAVYEFPQDCHLKSRSSLHILSRNGSKKQCHAAASNRETKLVADHLLAWDTGSHTITRLIDGDGNEQANLTQK